MLGEGGTSRHVTTARGVRDDRQGAIVGCSDHVAQFPLTDQNAVECFLDRRRERNSKCLVGEMIAPNRVGNGPERLAWKNKIIR